MDVEREVAEEKGTSKLVPTRKRVQLISINNQYRICKFMRLKKTWAFSICGWVKIDVEHRVNRDV